MSAPAGSPPPPHNQSPGCSNCLGIPDNPFGRPRMMLNMDLIDSSSESDDADDSFSELDSADDEVESASSSSELELDNYSGQCSDSGEDHGEAVEEDEYDRIFNRGVSTSSNENSADEETGRCLLGSGFNGLFDERL